MNAVMVLVVLCKVRRTAASNRDVKAFGEAVVSTLAAAATRVTGGVVSGGPTP